MEVDAFTEALGTRQGRLARDGGFVLVLGDVQARRQHALSVGDYVEWSQDVQLGGEALVRAQGRMSCPKTLPPDVTWEVSITLNGAKRARLRALPGRWVPLADLAAYVGDLAGIHRVGLRLELVSRDG